MILEIQIGDRRLAVEVDRDGGVRIDGEPVACDWLRVSDGRYSLLIDGRVTDLSVLTDGDQCHVACRGGSQAVRVRDPRRLTSEFREASGHAGLQRIRADMPGRVARVLVAPGDRVALDDALLVLEAMKMQNEIRAPKSGTVREVGVEAGRAVNTGDFLVSLE